MGFDFTDEKRERQGILQRMHDAATANDNAAFDSAFMELADSIQASVMQRAKEMVEGYTEQTDRQVLAARGVRQLTSAEKTYYQKVIDAMKSNDPKQALNNLDIVMPYTIIDEVFEELRTEHPLLRKLQFRNLTGVTKFMINTNGYQKAAWGKLCSEITEELTSGFKEVDATQSKLSAFLPVCKAMLDLGPEWLDAYVREVLYEAFANGLEYGFVQGTGKDMPIGMMRQVGDSVSVSGGEYPMKTPIAITRFDNIQLGKLAGIVAVNESGQTRPVRDLILVVNYSDYYSKVLPAIQRQAPGGGYINNLPFAMEIIPSAAVPLNQAVFGIAYQYFCGGGIGQGGRILYSDDYHFLEDERVYLIKGYALGFARDNNCFQVLDISGLLPAVYQVETVTEDEMVDNAELADLKVSGHTLNEAWNPSTVTTYTVNTSDASNTVTAIPADLTANVEITFGEEQVANGSALAWASGANTVTIKVTDGAETKTYTLTVTKS